MEIFLKISLFSSFLTILQRSGLHYTYPKKCLVIGKILNIFSKVIEKALGKPHNTKWAKSAHMSIDLWKTMLPGAMPWINGPWTIRQGKRIGTRSHCKHCPEYSSPVKMSLRNNLHCLIFKIINESVYES